MKRTYQPSNIKRKRRHGFRVRMRTKAGRQNTKVAQSQRQEALVGLNPCHLKVVVSSENTD